MNSRRASRQPLGPRLLPLIALTLTTLPTLISAQQTAFVLDYTLLPACARQCTILSQAEQSCTPPAAPVTEQAIYQSCYCQSALLTSLKVDQGALCLQAGCSQEDAGKIAGYYNNLCRAGGSVVTPPSRTDTGENGGGGETTTTELGAGQTGVDGKATGGGTKVFDGEEEPWIDTHWQYVVMAIIIVLAIAFFWIGGIFLRRHFERRADARRANLAASDAPYSHTLHSNMRAGTTSPYPMSQIESRGHISPAPGTGAAMMAAGAAGSANGKGKLRSRSSTISMGLGGSTKNNTPQQPVVWGPHQHLANARDSYSNTPGSTVPPSPTYAITSPPPTYGGGYGNGGGAYGRNLDAGRSDARFGSFRGTRSSLGVEEMDADSIERAGSPGMAMGAAGGLRPELQGGMGSGEALLTMGDGSGSGKLQKTRHH